MLLDDALRQCRSKMKKTIELLNDELKGLRTGRASTALVENLRVQYYGTPTPLKQLAVLAAPQPETIIIKPFDPASIEDIEKAIKSSSLSLAPILEGKLIRLNIPPLSEERRQQLIGQAKKIAEQAKVSIRNIRRDVNKQAEKLQKDKEITEDDEKTTKKEIDEVTKDYTDQVDKIVKHKSDEILEE